MKIELTYLLERVKERGRAEICTSILIKVLLVCNEDKKCVELPAGTRI